MKVRLLVWHYLIALALLVHGVGHILFLGNAWGYWKTGDGRGALFAALPQAAEGTIGLLWIVPLVAFVAAAGGYLMGLPWWRPALLAGAGISVLMLILWWGSLTPASALSAVVFDLVVVGALVWQRQVMASVPS
jgi:hypothetical protein